MDITIIFIIVCFLVLLKLLHLIFLYMRRKGTYKRVGETETTFMFKTDAGSFRFDKINKRLVIFSQKAKPMSLDFSELLGIRHRYKSNSAPFFELLRGFDIWDIFPNYMDRFCWYSIEFIKSNGGVIPVFLVGQYEPREPIMFIVKFEKWFMSVMGVYTEIDKYSKNVYECIITDMISLDIDLKIM